MGGVDTVRGIGYQQAQAVLAALDVLDQEGLAAIRVEGLADVVDIELLAADLTIAHGKQVKTKSEPYTWSGPDLVAVLRRWLAVEGADKAGFEFVTNGRLGPTAARVLVALSEAALGRPETLAEILAEDPDSPACKVLSRARIRVDPTPIGALLLQAEKQVAAIIPGARSVADAQTRATTIVDSLFRLLFVRASDPDSTSRIVTRAELAEVVGIEPAGPSTPRWTGSTKEACLTVNDPDINGLVAPRLRSLDMPSAPEDDQSGVEVRELLASAGSAAVLAGRTGEGKSTALKFLRSTASKAGELVLVVHAETYVPGRLAALAADAISSQLNRVVPLSTGRDALADPSVTIAIDGVSEVPADVRDELRQDLTPLATDTNCAHVVLAGRDIAALRSALPTSVQPRAFAMLPLDNAARRELIRNRPRAATEPSPQNNDELNALVAQAEAALADGAGNPLLLTMAVDLLESGVSFRDRPTLYSGFIELLVRRSGGTEIAAVTRVLGEIYVHLLDQGRRYADPYEWAGLASKAAESLALPGFTIDPTEVTKTALLCGLVTPIGYTQVLAPIHDSFADYLAGSCHAAGAPFPARLHPDDEQRLLFAAEVGGVTAEVAAAAASDLPFTAVRLSEFDDRPAGRESPDEVEHLLDLLLPPDTSSAVLLGRDASGRVIAARSPDRSAWVPNEGLMTLAGTHDAVVTTKGPLAIAVRLWRQHLISVLTTPARLGAPTPHTLTEACELLEAHERATSEAVVALIRRAAPRGSEASLLDGMAPLGMTAFVTDRENGPLGAHFGVRYRRDTNGVRIQPDQAGESTPDLHLFSTSTVEYMIEASPARAAAQRVREFILSLTVRGWL